MDNPDHDLEGGCRRAAYCTMCYAWASFLIWTIVIFLLIFGIAFFAFVRSNLPQVKVHRLDVYKFNVTEPKTQLEIDVKIMVNVTNNNKKMTLVYGKMNVETMIEGYSLPNVSLDGFRQKAMTTNDLKVHPQEMSSAVNDDDAKELRLTSEHNEMVLSLKMKGKIQFWYKGRAMSKLHLKVSCEGIEQTKLDQALPRECNVKLGFLM